MAPAATAGDYQSTWAYWRHEMQAIPASLWETIVVEKGFDLPEGFCHSFKIEASSNTVLLTPLGEDWDVHPHCGRFRQTIAWMGAVCHAQTPTTPAEPALAEQALA